MRRSFARTIGFWAGALGAASLAAMMATSACSSGSSGLGAQGPLPGTKDAAVSGTDGAVTSTSSGDGGAAVTTTDGSTPSGATLYSRLGGHTGIRTAVNAIAAAETSDPDIATYFVFQAGAPANDHPTVDQIEECFTDYIGSLKVVGGTETYPTTVTDDAGAFACRSMMASHMALNVSGGTFDHFMAIAGQTLIMNGVSTTDVATLAAALELDKSQIANATLYDAGLAPFDGGPD